MNKKKISMKLMGVVLSIALLSSLMVGIVPASANVSAVTVTQTSANDDISLANADYTIRFTPNSELRGLTAATLLLEAGAGGVTYTADTAGVAGNAITVRHLDPGGASVALSVAVVANDIVVTLATDVGSVITSTATTVFTAVNALPAAAALVTAAEDTAGLVAAEGPTSLAGGVDAGQTITVVFPDDTLVTATPTVAVTAEPMWDAGAAPPDWVAADTAAITWVGTALTRTIVGTLAAGNVIWEGKVVTISATAGITNPSTPGDYTLTVETSRETTAVTSAVYAIAARTVTALPGVVTLYNSTGGYLNSSNSGTAINDMIAAASAGDRVEVGPGTYDEDVILDVNIVLVATGGPAVTFITDSDASGAGGTVEIAGPPGSVAGFLGNGGADVTLDPWRQAVLDGFTITGNSNQAALTVSADGVIVRNNVFTKAGTATTSFAQTLVSYTSDALWNYIPTEITGNTFDTTLADDVDTAIDIIGSAAGLTISNNTFTVDEQDASPWGTDTAISSAGGMAAIPIAITGNTITGSSGGGIVITGGLVTITENVLTGLWLPLDIDHNSPTVSTLEFFVDPTPAGAGVEITAGAAGATFTYAALPANVIVNDPAGNPDASPVTLAADAVATVDSAWNGAAGTAIFTLTAGSLVISKSWGLLTYTEDDLPSNLDVTVDSNTISDSGATADGVRIGWGQWPLIGAPVVTIGSETVGTRAIAITNNVISGNSGYAINVEAGAAPADIDIMFNDLSGNPGTIATSMTGAVNAPLNWWGSADGAAGTTAHYSPTTTTVNSVPFLGSLGSGEIATGATDAVSLLTQDTLGVDVQPLLAGGGPWVPVAGDMISVGTYAENPGEATPIAALADGFYDVFLSAATAPATVALRFYNADISANTLLYVWSALGGTWAPVTTTATIAAQGVNTFSGFVWANITGSTTPSVLDLGGTVFALLDRGTAALTAPSNTSDAASPAFGAVDAAVNPNFTWDTVTSATGYEFELASDAEYADIIDTSTPVGNGIVSSETLEYDTVYYWRVRAVDAGGEGSWMTSFFTTGSIPAGLAEPADIIVEIPDPIIIPPPEVIVTPEVIVEIPEGIAPQAIPDYLLWVVVAVGAILVISVIVLIVRTRRVA